MCHQTDFDFCTNLLIMSSSDVDVLQKKADDECVSWKDHEALRVHLTGVIDRSAEKLEADVQAIQMKVDATDTAVNAMQTQINDLHTSIQQLTTST